MAIAPFYHTYMRILDGTYLAMHSLWMKIKNDGVCFYAKKTRNLLNKSSFSLFLRRSPS